MARVPAPRLPQVKGGVLFELGEPLCGEGLVLGIALRASSHHGSLEGSIIAVDLAIAKTNGSVRLADTQTLLLGVGLELGLLAPVSLRLVLVVLLRCV